MTGATGVLGWHLCHYFSEIGIPFVGTFRSHHPRWRRDQVKSLPLEDADAISEFFELYPGSAVIHSAAMTRPDDCEENPEKTRLVNVVATQVISESVGGRSPLIYISTDLVFDGQRGLYREQDEPNPVNVYGKSKLEAEDAVLTADGGIVLRMAKIYASESPFHPCFVTWMRTRFESGQKVPLFEDQYRSPVYVGDVVRALEILVRGEPQRRLYHFGGPERMTRLQFGKAYAAVFNFDPLQIEPIKFLESNFTARGADCSLDSSLFWDEFEFVPCDVAEGLMKLKRGRY